MKILIVDDEINNRTLLTKQLERIPIVENIQHASSAIEAISILKRFQPELVFLDIEMPGGSGFDFLEALSDYDFHIVFVTAHKKYAVDAVRTMAADYLLKPVDFETLKILVQRILGIHSVQKKNSNIDSIIVSTQEETFFLKPKNIIRLSGAGNYCIYHLADGREIVTSYVLKKAVAELPENLFFRVHNSHVINLNFIDRLNKVEGFTVFMKDKSEVPLSRRRKEAFLLEMKAHT